MEYKLRNVEGHSFLKPCAHHELDLGTKFVADFLKTIPYPQSFSFTNQFGHGSLIRWLLLLICWHPLFEQIVCLKFSIANNVEHVAGQDFGPFFRERFLDKPKTKGIFSFGGSC